MKIDFERNIHKQLPEKFSKKVFSEILQNSLKTAAFERLWYIKVLPYPCNVKILKHVIFLECCLQFSDNFLYEILQRDFSVTNMF